MLPLFDENPTRRMPLVTFLIIAVCIGLYVTPRLLDDFEPAPVTAYDGAPTLVRGEVSFHLHWAAIPCEVTEGRPLTSGEIAATFNGGSRSACVRGPIGRDEIALYPHKHVLAAIGSTLFLHAGLFHLALNCLFLWVFGNNVEDRLGHVPFLLFFLAGGVVATIAHIVVQPDSTLPVIGASGAIATVMGTYLMWFPDAPIRTLLFLIVVDIRARWFLGGWFGLQFFTAADGDVAWMSHAAGFVFGAVVGTLIRRVQPRLRLRARNWDRTGGAGHGPKPHLDEVWEEPHADAYE